MILYENKFLFHINTGLLKFIVLSGQQKMTVLDTEEDADKRSVPPRKKFCLSLSGRERTISTNISQVPQILVKESLLNRETFTYSM